MLAVTADKLSTASLRCLHRLFETKWESWLERHCRSSPNTLHLHHPIYPEQPCCSITQWQAVWQYILSPIALVSCRALHMQLPLSASDILGLKITCTSETVLFEPVAAGYCSKEDHSNVIITIRKVTSHRWTDHSKTPWCKRSLSDVCHWSKCHGRSFPSDILFFWLVLCYVSSVTEFAATRSN